MATKFIQLEEAAEQLGIPAEQLAELRSQNRIRGFRDGANWKFKLEDLQQLAATLEGEGLPAASAAAPEPDQPAESSDLELTLEDETSGGSDVPLAEPPGEAEGDSVLLSERELGGSDVTPKSTIIDDASESGQDSDITLAQEGQPREASDVQLVGDSMIKGSDIGLADSQLDLDAVDEGGLTLRQPAETPQEDSGSDLSLQFEDLSGLNLEALDESEEVKLAGESAVDAGSDLEIAGDSGLSLQGSDALAGASSELDLATSEDDEDELVLGEGSGSDITAGAGDSGISLADPTDSGLSLEEPPADLDLSGSQVDESLVLGEDDMITLGDDLAGASAPTALKTDDDFLLTPLEADDDLSESASQVIPLDEAGAAYDPSQATMLQPEGQTDLGEGLLLGEGDLTEGPTMIGGAAAAGPSFAGGPQLAPTVIMAPAIPEAPYSIWNVLSLFCCIAMLCLTGMLMYDVVRQMWSWEGTYAVNSDLMQAILNLFS